jgi:hypothetical protein
VNIEVKTLIDISSKDPDQNPELPRNYNSNGPRVFGIDARPYNLSYGEWTARWWQWALSIPIGKNPLLDDNGTHCTEGQNGPVWFLAGTTGKTYSASRLCNIPSGKGILLPIIASEFSFAEFPSAKAEEDLFSYVSKDLDSCSLLEAVVDDFVLQKLDRYRIRSGPFDINLPFNNVWNVIPGPTKAVSDGFWIFLGPLNDGEHTLRIQGIEPNFQTKVTYRLIIKPQSSFS